VNGAIPVIVQHSQLDGLALYGSDGSAVQVQSCSFGPVHIQASALQVSDSLFTDDAVFVPSENSNIAGNEFRGSKVVLYTTASVSTFRNNVITSGLWLCVPDNTTPISASLRHLWDPQRLQLCAIIPFR
jgi:hypothetical protein